MPFRLAAAALMLAALSTPLFAADAYVCDGGRVVYVRLEELEHMKRTDACIAGYYGLQVETPPAAAPASASAPPSGKASKTSPPAPKLLQSISEPEFARRKPVATASAASAKQAPVTAPNTDYRNIPILNAEPGHEAVFRHAR